MGETSPRLTKLQQQKAALQLKINAEEKRMKQQRRDDDTRRKILDGALSQNPKRSENFQAELDQARREEILTKDRYLYPHIWPDAKRSTYSRKKTNGGATLEEFTDAVNDA